MITYSHIYGNQLTWPHIYSGGIGALIKKVYRTSEIAVRAVLHAGVTVVITSESKCLILLRSISEITLSVFKDARVALAITRFSEISIIRVIASEIANIINRISKVQK